MKRAFITVVLIAANLAGLYILNTWVHEHKQFTKSSLQSVTRR